MDLSCEWQVLNPGRPDDNRLQCAVCGYTAWDEEKAQAHTICRVREEEALKEFRSKKRGTVYQVKLTK